MGLITTIKTLISFVSLIIAILAASFALAFLLLTIIYFDPFTFLYTVNQYSKLLLSSWPVVILFLGSILLIDQHKAISTLIEKIKSVAFGGPYGPKVEVNNQDVQKADDIKIEESPLVLPTVILPETNYEELYNLENIYNIIFGSQIKLLENLRLASDNGLSYLEIAAYFEKVKLEIWVPGGADLWTLEVYLTFLISRGLIEPIDVEKSRYRISLFGIKFLEHIEKNRFPKTKPL